jgi:hypothetical protein
MLKPLKRNKESCKNETSKELNGRHEMEIKFV